MAIFSILVNQKDITFNIGDNQALLNSITYTFNSTNFNTDDSSIDLENKRVVILNLPLGGTLELIGEEVRSGNNFELENSSSLKFILDDEYAIYDDNLFRFENSLNEIVIDYYNQSYEITNNINGKIEFTNTFDSSDIVYVEGELISNYQDVLSFDFLITDNTTLEIPDENNSGTFTFIPDGDVNILDGENLDPNYNGYLNPDLELSLVLPDTYEIGQEDSYLSTVKEIGTTHQINLESIFDKNDAGNIISHLIKRNGNTVSNNNKLTELITISSTPIEYQSEVLHKEGPCKSFDNNCEDNIKQGIVLSNILTMTGIYPVFYLKSSSPITATSFKTAVENGTASKSYLLSSNEYGEEGDLTNSVNPIEIPYEPINEYIAIGYPSTSDEKTNWQVTPLSQGFISETSTFKSAELININSPQFNWSNIEYRVHVSDIINNETPNQTLTIS